MTEGKCEYCSRPGPRRAGPEDGAPEDLFVCAPCWKLLQSPATAVPLLRGHVSLEMRGVVRPGAAEKLVSSFLSAISPWRPRPKSS